MATSLALTSFRVAYPAPTPAEPEDAMGIDYVATRIK
jgi:hypothetical protein